MSTSERRDNSKPPTRKTIFNLSKNNKAHKNLRDQRTVSSGRKLSVRSQENIDAVKEVLENARQRKPDQPGSSCRRIPLNITKTSFNRIAMKDLAWKPY